MRGWTVTLAAGVGLGVMALGMLARGSMAGEASPGAEERLAAAHLLLKTVDTEKQIRESIEAVVDQQVKANPMIAPYRKVMLRFFSKYMSWDSMKDEVAALYADAFTLEDLQQITAFYQSPAGKKLAELMPRFMSQGMELGRKRVAEHAGELKDMIEAESRRIENEGAPGAGKLPAGNPASDRQICIQNLRTIDHAKQVAAIKNDWTSGTLVKISDINSYLDFARERAILG